MMHGGKVKGTDVVLFLPTMHQIHPLPFTPCIILEISDIVYAVMYDRIHWLKYLQVPRYIFDWNLHLCVTKCQCKHVCAQFALCMVHHLQGEPQTRKPVPRGPNQLGVVHYNLINNFSIIACGARRARSCATAYLLTSAQHTLRAGIIRVDRELFH